MRRGREVLERILNLFFIFISVLPALLVSVPPTLLSMGICFALLVYVHELIIAPRLTWFGGLEVM